MTTEKSGAVGRNFVTATLPWFVGAGGFLVFCVTLNHWISLPSLPTVARVSGWLWQPEFGRPLTLAVLSLFRLLPDAWTPLAMNIFTAACAAAVLMLLARSVALLPHDLTPDDPLRRKKRPAEILSTPTAWMPPVLAAMICGLQSSFWESATSATGEMIGLLIFAYAVRCLFEFRMDQNDSWLYRGALIYAAGMANDWVMVAYAPVLVVAIIWVKGFQSFCEPRFPLRIAAWGLAGLSLYVLAPIVQSFVSNVSFWIALKMSLKVQRDGLLHLLLPSFRVLALTSLLPVLVLSIPWKSHTVQRGDDTGVGIFLTRITGHFVHAVFFFLSVLIALDPIFSPRQMPPVTPMLAYYYISALVAGYCVGYFLLLRAGKFRERPAKLPVAVTWALLLALPVTLLWKNFALIRDTNGPAVRTFARELYDDLPAGNSVALSENPKYLLLLQAELSARGRDKNALLLETPSLVLPQYHEFMAARFKTRWPLGPLTNQVEVMMPSQLMDLISGFATNEPVVYLHPSSGFFFERFVDEPNGSIHRLVLRPDEQVSTPALADPVIAANEYIWQERWTNNLFQLALRTKETLQPASRPRRSSASWLGLGIERSAATPLLGSAYSKSLNYWGVQMQRHGRSEEAGVWFQRAIELNPDNLAARINREYNERCRQGDNSRLAIRRTRQQFSYLFSKFDNWWEVVSDNGPADEPTFLLQSGRILLATWNPRQATDAFARCVELAPRWLTPKLWLAQSCNSMQSFAAALTFTDELQASGDLLSGTSLAQLFRCRVTAMRGLGRTNEADAYMESFVGKHKEQFDVLSMAANLYAQNSQFEHELALLQKLVDREPTNLELLSRKGLAELRLVRFENAIVTLTTALSLEPANENARLLRAVAHLRAGHLDAARNDYLELLKNPSSSEVALFGLGGVAWRERDTNAIVEYYQRYLTNATPGSSRYSVALERLNQLNDD